MSRLDYITIAIVAACILAIIFLVYKMTGLFNENQAVEPTETTTGQVEQEDSTYDYNIGGEGNQALDSADAVTDNQPASGESASTSAGSNTSSTTYEEEEDEQPATPRPATSGNTAPSKGKFMVIAGTFTQKASARRQLQNLKKMGYNNASIEPFDRGKFDVVLVDRFDNMADAERLVKDLKAEGINSYVKAKERNQ